MQHDGPVFLSASVPEKGDKFYETANPLLIRTAIADLVEVILGRKLLVWGGHPTITPIICHIANENGIEFESVAIMFQSKFFLNRYPTENEKFKNVMEVDGVKSDEKSSLKKLRKKMLSFYNYSAAVFIGGKEGVIREFEIFREYNPNAKLVVLPSTGGASKKLFDCVADSIDELKNTVNYSFWYRKLLEIDMGSERREFTVEEIRKKWLRKPKSVET